MAASALTLSLLFAAVLCVGSGAAGADRALDDVCRSLGAYYITPELCKSALCHDPSSPCRGARGGGARGQGQRPGRGVRIRGAGGEGGPAVVPAAVHWLRAGAGVGGGVRGRGAVPRRPGAAGGGAPHGRGVRGLGRGGDPQGERRLL
jgi:hypothetical protein